MYNQITIGERQVGENEPVYIIAEVGINHNGDLDIAKKLIDIASFAGCDAVKFQKRTIDIVYSREELGKARESPFGTTNGDLKRGLEFGQEEYEEIDLYCRSKGIDWFASCWDEPSVDFIRQFDPVAYKIASASITDKALLLHLGFLETPLIVSTGMTSLVEIQKAVEILGQDNLALLHCTSTYPSRVEELNLRAIETLRRSFSCPVGYSGHEVGLQTTVAAVVLGACIVERHITLDRAMWGSDQSASIEPQGLIRLVRDIRSVEAAMGDGEKHILISEVPVMKKLRRVCTTV